MAAAILRPDDLRNITLAAVAPFFDFTLAGRCAAAAAAWRAGADMKFANAPAFETARVDIAAAYYDVREAVDAFLKVHTDAQAVLEGAIDIGEKSIPAPAPLFTTDDDFATATRKLIAEKRYEGGESDD